MQILWLRKENYIKMKITEIYYELGRAFISVIKDYFKIIFKRKIKYE